MGIFDDNDHDGAHLDDIGSAVAGAGTKLGAAAFTLGTSGWGLPAAVAANEWLAPEVAEVGGDWGDQMSDLLGTRDMTAENASEHGQGIGGQIRESLDPHETGDRGAIHGALAGGYMGLSLLGGPGAMIGSGIGAAGGMALGNQVDRGVDAVGHGVDQARELFGHWMD